VQSISFTVREVIPSPIVRLVFLRPEACFAFRGVSIFAMRHLRIGGPARLIRGKAVQDVRLVGLQRLSLGNCLSNSIWSPAQSENGNEVNKKNNPL
jgi:hypothetical protein